MGRPDPATVLELLLDDLENVVARTRARLDEEAAPTLDISPAEPTSAEMDATWRTRLWTVPADTLLGVPEIAEALGRSVSWTHKRTAPSSDDPLPVRKLGASVVVTAGDLREWIQDHLEAA